MTELMRRRRALMGVASQGGGGHSLPAEYQEVTWIESTGTQWINTDISLGSDTFSCEIKFYKQSQVTASLGIVSLWQYPDSDQRFSINFRNSANKYGIYDGSWSESVFSQLYGNDVVAEVQYSTSPSLLKATVTANGLSDTITNTRQKNSVVGTHILLFAATQNATRTPCRIMYCRFLENGIAVANLIPCYRKSDTGIGMYDLVGNKFYGNSGYGTFLKGADV